MFPATVSYNSVRGYSSFREVTVACVQWFKEYPNNSLFKNPLSVYYAKVFKLPGPATFIPVQRIQSRFVAINRRNNNVDTVIVCPLLPRTFI